MVFGLIILSIPATFLAIFCPYRMIREKSITPRYRLFIVLSFVGILAVAYGFTFWFTYSRDANTVVHGWPVPIAILQRPDTNSPWSDFIGMTTLLGYPINAAIFLTVWFLPQYLMRLLHSRRKRVSTPN
jgi:energy-coupling factor transporter transmembrane protein EcfT